MDKKVRATTYNIVMTQLASVLIFPIVWILFGSIFTWVIIETETLPSSVTQLLYYLGLLGSYYLGLKHSFKYMSKTIIVTQPKVSGKVSSFIFVSGLIGVYYAWYIFTNEYDFFRMGAFIILGYMYTLLTYKYFNTLEVDDETLEYSFLYQVCFTIVNVSVVLAIGIGLGLMMWFIKDYTLSYSIYLLMAPLGLLAVNKHMDKVNHTLFIPYFYRGEESMPLKRITTTLFITIPINAILLYILYKEVLF
ncbi:hypothetical protein ACFLR3_00570 [Campylobacterota bacterium]